MTRIILAYLSLLAGFLCLHEGYRGIALILILGWMILLSGSARKKPLSRL